MKSYGESHQSSGEKIKGITATIGCNGIVSSSGNNKTHLIEFNYLKEEKDREVLNIILKIMEDDQKIN
jgi:hypothetical protein